MLTLSEAEIIHRINNNEVFTAALEGNAFTIKIDKYIPVVHTAIHDGHNLAGGLHSKCRLDDQERRYEEDPFTGDMIQPFPITLRALDSRYMYDLNRPPETCVYKEAWGKQVWSEALTEQEIERNTALHNSYYRVLNALLSKLEQLFDCCLVYDLHSYNYLRIGVDTPLFNIGTHSIDTERWQAVIKHLEKQLLHHAFSNIENRVALDEVFQGKGYQAAYIRQHFNHTVCIPLELKKVFMEETSGQPYPLVLDEFKENLKQAFSRNAAYFTRKFSKKTSIRRTQLLAKDSDPEIRRVDSMLYRLAKGVDTLLHVNPINLVQEKKRFFSRHFNYEPQFSYRQLKIDPFAFREKLYSIPVDAIEDISIRQLYRSTIDSFAHEIDMMSSIGTDNFLYNSLRYYGEPKDKDLANARFFLYAPALEEDNQPVEFSAADAKRAFHQALNEYGIDCKVEISSRIVARAMVNNAKKVIYINRSARFNAIDLQALVHHELGVHMVTTMNSLIQPLKIFKLGLPGNTHSQEGLAILSEYLSGNMSLQRLKVLAYRVLAVDMLVQGVDFSHTFKALTGDYGMQQESAFNTTARVYRGGGFTKDYLYLSGLREALNFYASGSRIENMFIGKTSFKFLDILNEMQDKKLIKAPQYLPVALKQETPKRPILDYLLKSIH